MSADAFVDCAERGDLEGVRQHLYEGVDINHITKRGSTALMCAAANGHDDIVIFLIRQGVDRTITNEKGRTALDYAIRARKYRTARLFSEYVVAEALNSGRTSLQRLRRGLGDGRSEATLSTDINLNFIEAATEGDLDTVKRLMPKVANVDVRDSDGWTAFAMAAAHNHVEIARFLLDSGAEADARGFKERTPLMLAANNGCMDAVVFLIANGADAEAKDADGCKASMYSDLHGYGDISRLLKDAESAINMISVSRPALGRLRRRATVQKAKTIQ